MYCLMCLVSMIKKIENLCGLFVVCGDETTFDLKGRGKGRRGEVLKRTSGMKQGLNHERGSTRCRY